MKMTRMVPSWMMRSSVFFLGVVLASAVGGGSDVWAAVPQKDLKPSASGREATRAALELPLANRLLLLQDQGPEAYRHLVGLMFDKKIPMETRWRAVTAAARIGGESSRSDLEKAMTSPEWFMRNSGLVAIELIDQKMAADWARKLLSDPALIVRAAAVDAIARLKDESSRALLWEKLNAEENFKGRQSLFIRRKIVETLATLETKGREAKFIEILADADESLHAPAIQALERMTQKSLGMSKEPLPFKRAHWLKWWGDKNKARL